MEKQLISILMAVYNEEKFLKYAIESVLKQSYDNIELVIVNDLSVDQSMDIAKYYASIDSRIKVIDKQRKMGKTSAFNCAFSESRGQYICMMGGDDILPAFSLAMRSEPFMVGNRYLASVCKLKMISTSKKYDGVIVPKSSKKGTFSGGTLMVNRRLADMVFPIPTELGNEDIWWTEHVNSFAEEVFHIPRIGYYYRIHESNSIRPNDLYAINNEKMHSRFIAYKLFREKYTGTLRKYDIQRLTALELAETNRYMGNPLKILTLINLSLKDKIRFIAFSHPLLLLLRNIFYRLFSGW